jgi:septal ring factor EnvC (AmiA/AmiB activator)
MARRTKIGGNIMATTHPIQQHEQIFSDMQKKLDDHESRIREVQEFTIRHEEQTKDLWRAVGRIEQLVTEIKLDIDKLKEKPAKHWDSLIGYIISGIVMLIIAYMGRFIFP